MSSFDRGRHFRLFGGTVLALATALALSACTMQPLYGPAPSGKAVASVLASFQIDEPNTRVAQEVRNALIEDLSGGQSSAPVYRMRLSVTSAESAFGVNKIESAPVYAITVSATYEITSLATGDIVLRGTSRGTGSYDRINQSYANTRARIDAENRAAIVAADDLRVKLAAAAARGVL